jgi:hypothetical protein
MDATAAPRLQGDEDVADGCFCDIEFDERNAVCDRDLPPAAGGVQAAIEKHGDEDRIDGCDVDFNTNDVTMDWELPVATGGA